MQVIVKAGGPSWWTSCLHHLQSPHAWFRYLPLPSKHPPLSRLPHRRELCLCLLWLHPFQVCLPLCLSSCFSSCLPSPWTPLSSPLCSSSASSAAHTTCRQIRVLGISFSGSYTLLGSGELLSLLFVFCFRHDCLCDTNQSFILHVDSRKIGKYSRECNPIGLIRCTLTLC